jgi:hypothetical protein
VLGTDFEAGDLAERAVLAARHIHDAQHLRPQRVTLSWGRFFRLAEAQWRDVVGEGAPARWRLAGQGMKEAARLSRTI